MTGSNEHIDMITFDKVVIAKLLIWVLGIFYTNAQMGLHTQFLLQQPSSLTYQPANILRIDFKNIAVGSDASVYLGNNSFRVDPLFREGNFISEQTKDEILRQFNANNNQLHQGLHIGGYFLFRLGGLPISLSVKRVKSTYLRINDPGTAGLILRGNAPFAGERISDESLAYRNYDFWEASVGTGWQVGRWLIGARIKAVLGNEADILDELSYSLFTESDGRNISIQSTYTYYDTEGSGINGLGTGIDLGISYLFSEKVFLQLAVLNAGFINWDGNERTATVDFEYSGEEIDNLLSLGLNNYEFNIADTLESLFFPSKRQHTFLTPLPTILNFGGAYQFTAKDRLMGSVTYGLTNYGPTTDLPLINMAYHRKITPYFVTGINVYGGGMDLYGLGGLVECKLPLGNSAALRLYYHLDNAMGMVFAQGVSMNGGIGFIY